jgi:hypothetical protein
MISVKQNIKIFRSNINDLINQRNEITNEILRLEGALRVMTDMEKAGVTEIQVPKNPLETTEVIDAEDVQAGGSEPTPKND